MTLYTFTLDSGRGLLGVAGLQIKEVSYYLRLKSLSVTRSYGHPRQGSGQRRIRVGNNSKQGASGTRRQLGSSDSHGHQSRTFNCGALAPRHQEPEVDPQFPDYVESSTPSQAMLYHRYTSEQAQWPSLGGTLPAPGRTSSDNNVLPDTPSLLHLLPLPLKAVPRTTCHICITYSYS